MEILLRKPFLAIIYHVAFCFVFVVDLAKNQTAVDIFRTHGIGVMTVTAFLQTVAHKPPAVVLPMPEPSKLYFINSLNSNG